MPRDLVQEPSKTETGDHGSKEKIARANPDEQPTECGLTRAELRALVIEMIG